MKRLDICLSQSDYSVRYGCPIEKMEIRGGHARYYKKTNTKKHLVNATIKVQRDKFVYFRQFYQQWQKNPEKFIIGLIIDESEYKDHEANFVKESVSMSFTADFFTVSFQLTVFSEQVRVFTSLMYPFEFDESIQTSSELLDAKTRDLLNIYDDKFEITVTESSIVSAKYISSFNAISNVDNSADGFVGSIDKDDIKTSSSIVSVKYIDTLNKGYINDDIKTVASIASVKYRDALIQHTIDVEPIKTTSAIVSAKILT